MGQQSDEINPLKDKFNDYEFTPSNNLFDGISDALENDAEKGSLSETMEGYSHPVNEKVWNNIDEELHPKKRRRFVFWLTGTAAGMAMVLGAFSLLNQYELKVELVEKVLNENSKGGADKVAVQETNGQKVNRSKIENKKITPSDNEVSLIKPKFKNVVGQSRDVFSNNDTSKRNHELEVLVDGSKQTDYKVILVNPLKLDFNKEIKERITKVQNENMFDELFPEEDEENKKQTGYRLSSLAGPILATNTYMNQSSAGDVLEFNSDFQIDNSGMIVNGFGSNDVQNSISVVAVDDVQTGTEYKNYGTPFSVGGLLEFDLNKRLALSTGVIYTRVGFEYESSAWDVLKRRGTQKYIGIPINLTCNIIQKPKFKFYPVIGVQTDFGIGGKDKLTYLSGTSNEYESTIKQSSPGVQFSALTGVGISYNLIPKLSLFTQSLYQQYLITNRSSYYNSHLNTVSIQAGIKFEF